MLHLQRCYLTSNLEDFFNLLTCIIFSDIAVDTVLDGEPWLNATTACILPFGSSSTEGNMLYYYTIIYYYTSFWVNMETSATAI